MKYRAPLIIAVIFSLLIIGCSKHSSDTAMKTDETIASQPPGQVFPWPQGIVLAALDEATIALPMAIFGKDEQIGSVVLGPVDMQINIPKQGDTFYIRLKPGMSVSLTKSCQARVVAEDKQPRRFKISSPHVKNAA
jgi:hypothetical protein